MPKPKRSFEQLAAEAIVAGARVIEIPEAPTLRDRFAMAVLPALVTSALDEDHKSWNATAQHAYLIADAMLKERQQ